MEEHQKDVQEAEVLSSVEGGMEEDAMSCLFGKETEKQCTSLRADDCGSKSLCGVWVGSKQDKRVVPAESFVGTMAANVDNKKMSDKDFREMVRRTLPIVIYDVRMDGKGG